MNSVPVIIHNLSGACVMADVRVPKGTTRTSIIPVDNAILANCALLDAGDHASLMYDPEAELVAQEEEAATPFSLAHDYLDRWAIEGDCPGLATLLEVLDRAGIGRSFDLKYWLDRWRRA